MEWFALGSISFWVLTAMAYILSSIVLVDDEEWAAIVVVLIYGVILLIFGHIAFGTIAALIGLGCLAIIVSAMAFSITRSIHVTVIVWLVCASILVWMVHWGPLSHVAVQTPVVAGQAASQPITIEPLANPANSTQGGESMEAIATFFASLFVIGSVGFWVLCFLVSLAVWYSTYEDHDTEDDSPEGGILAGVSILALFFLVWAFNRTHMSDWFQNHLVQFIAFAVGYIGVSPLWGFTKWYFFVRARKRRRDQRSADFLENFPDRIKRARDAREKELLENEKENSLKKELGKYYECPTARAHRYRIMRWMMFWPWSFVFTVLNIRKIFSRMIDLMEKKLNKIAANIWEESEPVKKEVASV